MDPYLIILVLHLFGFAWGVGSATVSDFLFLKAIKDKVITGYEFETLNSVSKVVITGIFVAVLSGISLLTYQYFETGSWTLLSDPRFQMKATLVGLVVINGFIFHKFIFPLMEKYKGKSLNNKEINSKLWAFALTGSVSITSWYGAALLAFLKELSTLSYLSLSSIYLLILFTAFICSYLVISRIISIKR